MIKVNIHEAKTNLSKYLKKVEKGQRVVLCRRNVPVAELRLVPAKKGKNPLFGMDKGKIVIHPEFFDPMPDDFLAHFDGRK